MGRERRWGGARMYGPGPRSGVQGLFGVQRPMGLGSRASEPRAFGARAQGLETRA